MWVSQVPKTPTWRICNPSVDNRDGTSRNRFQNFDTKTINIFREIEVTAEFTVIIQKQIYFFFKKLQYLIYYCCLDTMSLSFVKFGTKIRFWTRLFVFSSKMSILEKIEKGVCYSEQSQKWMVGTTISKNEFLINVWWNLRQ